MLSRFHLIPERYGQTDRQTDRIAILISRVSVLTRDNNYIDGKDADNFSKRGLYSLPVGVRITHYTRSSLRFSVRLSVSHMPTVNSKTEIITYRVIGEVQVTHCRNNWQSKFECQKVKVQGESRHSFLTAHHTL